MGCFGLFILVLFAREEVVVGARAPVIVDARGLAVTHVPQNLSVMRRCISSDGRQSGWGGLKF